MQSSGSMGGRLDKKTKRRTMITLKRFYITLFTLIIIVLYGCTSKVFPIEEHGLLWKISGNGLTHPSYLFGTFHKGNAIQVLDSIKGFHSAFESCSQYAGEVYWESDSSLNGYKDPQLLSIKKPWPADSTYEKIFSKEDLASLDSFANGNEVLKICIKSKSRPSVLKSWANYYIDQSNNKNIKDSFQNDMLILDRKLQNKAFALKYKIIGLETLKERYILLKLLFKDYGKTLSYKAEGKSLIDYVRHHQLYDSIALTNLNFKLNIYLNQNISIDTLNLDEQKREQISEIDLKLDSRTFYLYFIEKRNASWINRISGIIRSKPTFIAVGALHLGGQSGLINQLRELGYSVENVK